jgi:predicted dehydrogenase
LVKIGVIGYGNIGSMHVRNFESGVFSNVQLTAVFDIDPERIKTAESLYGNKLKYYTKEEDFFKSREFDAVLVATPHYAHPVLAEKALDHGYHVLVEKPIGVYTKAVKRLYKKAEASDKVFGVVFNQRTNPLYQKVKDLVSSGELGVLKRINWIITDWYRTQAYYNSGTWRATWGGEGGGVLINQCPHQLDLFQWIFGMPKRVRGFAYFGKNRNIEVEDEVTAYFEYENGATGVFISSVSEVPGTNRLEITGDKGKIIIENGKIEFYRLRESEIEYNKNLKVQGYDKSGNFAVPEYWKCEIPVETSDESQHVLVIKDWIDTIINGTPLLAPGTDAINELMISNAVYLSTFIDNWVEFPIDEDLFLEKLNERVKTSKYKVEKNYE